MGGGRREGEPGNKARLHTHINTLCRLKSVATCKSSGPSSSSTFGELPFDEYTTSEIDLLSVMKFNVWKMLKNLKLRVRIFISLSVEISVPGTYVLCMCRTLGSNLRRGKDNL